MPILNSNNNTIRMLGGNWYNYNTSGFDEGLGTVIFLGTITQTINCPGGERYFRLTFSKQFSSTLQFNCPINVIQLLTWTTDGPIFLNSNRLTIESGAVTAMVNSNDPDRYLISETVNNSSIVQWNIGTVALASNYVIPFGKPGVPNYIPFTYSIPTGTTVGNLAVATYGTPANNLPWPVSPYLVTNLNSTTGLLPDNRDATVDRFWEITASAGSPTATCTFTYAPAELPVAPFNNMALMVAQWFNPGTSKWIYPIAGQTTGTYTTTTPGFNTYGAWTLAAITSPLPVKLLSFSAKPNGEQVDLDWSTATEINNDYFTIERSYDGVEFSDLKQEKGAGNSNVILNYSAIDERPLPGISYYRLKQTDFDRQFSYSEVIAVKFTTDSRFFIQAGPVPATDKIRLTCLGGTDFSPELYQLDGRLVKIFSNVSEGISDLDISGIAGGIYILRVNSDFGQKSLRIVKE
ncbi:MAG: T9SS type A sorting domain-containing protein [Bacteroidetes bacterium]|nr:T9SS type A sorting domain-containing protein [Bacteroidota bacterium]